MKHIQKALGCITAAALCGGSLVTLCPAEAALHAAAIGYADIPGEYIAACEWVWNNRIYDGENEDWMKDYATIYDQLIAGNGTIHYLIRWDSYQTLTYDQRQRLEVVLNDTLNQWNDCLEGYANWPFDDVTVKIVGWSVLDRNCMQDLHSDEVVYTGTMNSTMREDIINSGMATDAARIPAIEPTEPTDISRYAHWWDKNWSYNGSYDNRYDMFLEGIDGMIDMGGFGWHYGQYISASSILGLINGTASQHILLHEMGHGFGFPDYYGGIGESDGLPPGDFPGGEGSVMQAGRAARITVFDTWFARYAWSRLSAQEGRFDLSTLSPSVPDEPIEPDLPSEGDLIGDINRDGTVDIADVSLLQAWLLSVSDTYLPNWKAGDIDGNGRLNVADITLLKRLLLTTGTPDTPDNPDSPEIPDTPTQFELIPATVSQFGKLTPSVGDCKMLSVFVEFSDTKYTRALPIETVRQELFGISSGNDVYGSIPDWYARASYGNLHIEGNAYYYNLPGKMTDYMTSDRNFEVFFMEVLSGLDAQINYADYDANNDGIIDCVSVGVPLDYATDEQKEYWWGCTGTWWSNPNFALDGKQLNKYIILDVSPYTDTMEYLKTVLTHEMGHSLGLPDYYLYEAGNDWEAYHGAAGYERMDESIGDFSSFSKLMFGWLRENEVQWYSGGTQSFTLKDSATQGSCLIVPISSSVGDLTAEYFLVEYVTHNGNNAEMNGWTNDSGIRIFHINAELIREDWSGLKNFKYEGFSQYYQGNDRFRITRLVNDGQGFYHTGDICTYGTNGFAGYDANGYQTVDTGYTIEIGALSDGVYTVTVRK